MNSKFVTGRRFQTVIFICIVRAVLSDAVVAAAAAAWRMYVSRKLFSVSKHHRPLVLSCYGVIHMQQGEIW